MRCRFCNSHFTTAGQYGRHLRTHHPGKALGSNSSHEGTSLATQGVLRTIKRTRLTNSSSMTNTLSSSSQRIVDLNNPLVNAKSPDSRCTPTDPVSPDESLEERLPASLKVGQVIRRSIFTHIRDPSWNPLSPFSNAYEYKLARFFHQSKTSMKQIDQFFHDELLPSDTFRTLGVGYKSGHTWRNKMRGLVDQPQWQNGSVDFHL